MKLTNDDFEEEYDADRWNTQIIKIFDSYDEQQQFKQQILENQEKAAEWDKVVLNPDYIEQTENALKELRKENKQLKENFVLANKWASEQTQTINKLKEELRKYQILQYSPKELEIELNKKIINRLKLEKIEELLKDTNLDFVSKYTFFGKLKKILEEK